MLLIEWVENSSILRLCCFNYYQNMPAHLIWMALIINISFLVFIDRNYRKLTLKCYLETNRTKTQVKTKQYPHFIAHLREGDNIQTQIQHLSSVEINFEHELCCFCLKEEANILTECHHCCMCLKCAKRIMKKVRNNFFRDHINCPVCN